MERRLYLRKLAHNLVDTQPIGAPALDKIITVHKLTAIIESRIIN